METLFSLQPDLPAGFIYEPNFITVEEEKLLVELIQTYPLKNMIFQGFEAKRKVLSFGYDYNFGSRKLLNADPIPAEFNFIIKKVATYLSVEQSEFAKLLLTQYETGTVINWHRDSPPYELIAGISLASDCTFKLRPYDKARQNRAAVKSFTVARRSLYIMKNEARYDWEHSITPVKNLRYSITMRTLVKSK